MSDVAFAIGIHTDEAKAGRDAIVKWNAQIAGSYDAVLKAAQAAGAGLNIGGVANTNIAGIAGLEKSVNALGASIDKLAKSQAAFIKAAQEGVQASTARTTASKAASQAAESEAQAIDRITQRMAAAKAAREAQTQATQTQKAAQDALNASIAAGAGGQVSNGGLLATAKAAEQAAVSVEKLTKAQKEADAASSALVKSADTLVGRYAPLMKAQQQLAADRAALTKLQKEGTLTATEEAAVIAGLEAKQRNLDNMQKTLGGSTKAQALHFQSLKYQLNDVISGFLMGQPPMMIFVQQGGQIVQALDGMGLSLAAVNPATIALGVAIGATAAAALAATAAHMAYAASAKEVDRINRLYGASVGMTTDQLLSQADAAAASAGVSKLAARDIQNSYLATGKIGGQVMSDLTKITRDYAAATAQDVDKASSDLAGMFSDPAKAVDELNNKYRMFDDSQTQLIKNYQAQGQLERAQIIILDEMRNRIQGAGDRLAWYTKLWENAKGLVVDAGSLVAPATKQEEADFIQKRLSGATGKLSSREVADLTVQLSALQQEINNDAIAAWAAEVRADFDKTTVAVGDFARSIDPAQAATTAFSNAQKLINDAIAKYPSLQAQGTQALALYKAQLLDAMNPAQAFALEMERQGRVLEAAAGRARDFEQQRQIILQKRGAQPNEPLTPQERSDINAGLDAKYTAQAKDNHRIAQEAAEDAKILARAQASTSPAAMVAAQAQVAYNKTIRETKDATHPLGDVQAAQQAKQDALAKGYAELSGQIGAQVTQLNQQTTAQDRLAAAAGKGEAAMRAATAENNIAAAALRGVGEATARAAENAKELATQKQIHAEFASGIDLEAAATGRLVKAMSEGVSATRDAEIYNKAIVQAMKEVPPTYDAAGNATGAFKKHVDDAVVSLKKQQDALDSKAFADYEEKLKAQNRQLQLQQKLIGATPSQAAKLQVENDINEQLIAQKRTYADLSDAEKAVIDRSRERALQNADLEQQIARQKDAYDTIANSLEKSFERVGDALVNAFVEGKGSAVDFGNVAKGIISSLLTDLVKMSVVRPLSNSLFGTNYGTIFDLGGGSAANQNGGTSTSGLVNFGVSKGLGYLWDKASSFLGFGGSAASSSIAAGVVPSASVQASQIAALQAVNPGFAASSYVPVVGGVNAVPSAASGLSLSSLGSIASGALSLAGAGYSIGGYLGTLTNSKAVGGLTGGAAAGALAGTMAMPGIGTVIGAIIGGIAGMLGTQKATVGKTASADVTINAGGKSATYGNILTDNEGDPAAGRALGTALSGIYSIAAMGGGTLTKDFGIGQTAKNGLYVSGSVPYKEFGDDVAGLLRYTLLDQGGLKDGGANTIAALKNSTAKDWEEAAKDIGLGASIDAGNTALKEMVKTLSGVTDAAKKATTESFKPMFEELDRAKKLGIDGAYKDLATDQLKAYLDQLRNPPDFTQVQTDMATLTGQFQAARDAYAQLNPAMVTYVDQIEKETRARIAANLNKSLDQQINEANGRGYVNQINGLMDNLSANARSLAAVGEPVNRAQDLFNVSLTELLRTLRDDQLADVVATFGGDIGNLATQLAAANDNLQQATRFEELFSQIRQDNINAEISALNEQKSAASSLLSSWKNLSSSIAQARQSLLIGDLSTLDPKSKMDAALSAYRDALTKAQGGDVDAAGQVSGLAHTALQAARAYYASNEDYARIFNEVTGGLEGVESVASRQVSLQTAAVSRLDSQLAVQQDMLKALQVNSTDLAAILAGINSGNINDILTWSKTQDTGTQTAVNDAAAKAAKKAKLEALGNADIERLFGGFSDIQAARAADPSFNLALWFKTYGINEVLNGQRVIAGFADGGVVGNGMYGVDSVVARYAGGGSIALAGGEYVMPADQTAAYRPVLDAMRAGTWGAANDRWAGVAEFRRPAASGGGNAEMLAELRNIGRKLDNLLSAEEGTEGAAQGQRARIAVDVVEKLDRIASALEEPAKRFA